MGNYTVQQGFIFRKIALVLEGYMYDQLNRYLLYSINKMLVYNVHHHMIAGVEFELLQCPNIDEEFKI